MKEIRRILTCFLLIFAFAAVAELPQSIMLESGAVRVRLDGRKRWNMNRIEYKNNLICVDNPNAHYGMTCRPIDLKYAVGSGHEETGFGEEVVSVKIFSDGKEVIPQKNITIKSKKIQVEKVSKILAINVKYIIILENDVITEFIEASASKEMKLHHLYFFMHPWSPRFTDLHIANDKKQQISFASNDKFVNRNFVEKVTFYDKNSGVQAATTFKKIKGDRKLQRFIWDRKQYRKDYLCDYFMATLPANHVISYEARTVFSQK